MRILLLLSLLLCTTSCSRVNLAKRWGDTALWWQVNGLVDYSGAAKKSARTETDKIYEQVKESEFLFWAERLEILKLKIETKTLKLEDLSAGIEATGVHSEALVQKVRPQLMSLVDLMGEKEFANLIKNYRERIEKEKSESEDEIYLQKRSQERFVSILEFFLGSLTKEQHEQVSAFFALEKYPYKLQSQNKYRYLAMIEETKADKAKLKKLADSFMQVNASIEEPEFQKSRKTYGAKLLQLASTILQSVSEKQRERLIKTLSEVILDLKAN